MVLVVVVVMVVVVAAEVVVVVLVVVVVMVVEVASEVVVVLVAAKGAQTICFMKGMVMTDFWRKNYNNPASFFKTSRNCMYSPNANFSSLT